MSKAETCVCCGRVIPEGSQYCVICGYKIKENRPKFIEHIHLDIPKDFTPKENALGDIECSITNKIMIEQVEKIDNEICERIKDIAILNGIDEVYVIDRNAILSALEKQIPKKPNIETIKSDVDIASGEYETETNYTCPDCGEVVGSYDKDVFYGRFCCDCGQALDWGG